MVVTGALFQIGLKSNFHLEKKYENEKKIISGDSRVLLIAHLRKSCFQFLHLTPYWPIAVGLFCMANKNQISLLIYIQNPSSNMSTLGLRAGWEKRPSGVGVPAGPGSSGATIMMWRPQNLYFISMFSYDDFFFTTNINSIVKFCL